MQEYGEKERLIGVVESEKSKRESKETYNQW